MARMTITPTSAAPPAAPAPQDNAESALRKLLGLPAAQPVTDEILVQHGLVNDKGALDLRRIELLYNTDMQRVTDERDRIQRAQARITIEERGLEQERQNADAERQRRLDEERRAIEAEQRRILEENEKIRSNQKSEIEIEKRRISEENERAQQEHRQRIEGERQEIAEAKQKLLAERQAQLNEQRNALQAQYQRAAQDQAALPPDVAAVTGVVNEGGVRKTVVIAKANLAYEELVAKLEADLSRTSVIVDSDRKKAEGVMPVSPIDLEAAMRNALADPKNKWIADDRARIKAWTDDANQRLAQAGAQLAALANVKVTDADPVLDGKTKTLDQQVRELDRLRDTPDKQIQALDRQSAAIDRQANIPDQRITELDLRLGALDRQANVPTQEMRDLDIRARELQARATDLQTEDYMPRARQDQLRQVSTFFNNAHQEHQAAMSAGGSMSPTVLASIVSFTLDIMREEALHQREHGRPSGKANPMPQDGSPYQEFVANTVQGQSSLILMKHTLVADTARAWDSLSPDGKVSPEQVALMESVQKYLETHRHDRDKYRPLGTLWKIARARHEVRDIQAREAEIESDYHRRIKEIDEQDVGDGKGLKRGTKKFLAWGKRVVRSMSLKAVEKELAQGGGWATGIATTSYALRQIGKLMTADKDRQNDPEVAPYMEMRTAVSQFLRQARSSPGAAP
jgi:hypothetical protein